MAESVVSSTDSGDDFPDFSSSDSESDFSGFSDYDLMLNAQFLREVDMIQSVKDRDQPDLNGGWSRRNNPPTVAPFTGESTLLVNIQGENEPIDFLKLFLTDDFIDLLVTQTNLYAVQVIQRHTPLPPNSRFHKWSPVCAAEMKRFFALIICMGLTKKSSLEDYWSKNETMETPIFSKYMSRNRFLLILSNLHMVDNNADIPGRGQPGHDPLYKVRPFITLLNDKFGTVYSPNRDLSLDEATCAYKGRVRFRTYNPMKPNKFGLKLYQICEAESGYCIGFHVYHGKDDDMLSQFSQLAGTSETCSKTTHVVVGMLEKHGFLNKGHRVFADNYYNSPELCEELAANDTYICGTVRINRQGIPKAFSVVKNLRQGDCIFRRKDNTLVVKYHDKRDVNLISSCHEAKMAVMDRVDANNVPVRKPTIIVDYIRNMGGVDLSDQVIQYYSAFHKTVKWSTKLFFHLFGLLMVNAFLLAKKACVHFSNKKRAHIIFRQEVAKSLLAESVTVPLPNRRGRQVQNPVGRLTLRHFPSYIPAKEGAKRRRPLRDCKVCNKLASERAGYKRTQTSFMCIECNVALCVPECFKRFHTLQNYQLREQSSSSDSE